MVSIGPGGGYSTRIAPHIATNTNGGVSLLNNKGVDAQGTKHLTSGQRAAQMTDGFKKAHGNVGAEHTHRNQAAAANANAKATYAGAAANGNITKHEQRNINSANRDATIANKQVAVDNASKHLGHVKMNAARDGRITPGEQANINGAQGNLNRLQGQLNHLKAKDSRLDARDAQKNTFGDKIGSAIQDSLQIGKKVAPSFGGPSGCIPKPHIQLGGGGSAHVGMRCGGHLGGSMGCIKPNFNGGGGGCMQIGPPPRNLGFGQQIGMMIGGNAKAQYTGSDFKHQLQANNANANVKNTYSNARADGHISQFERRDIAGAHRDANIANKQVAYDGQRRHVGNLERNYAADGRLSMGEQMHLNSARGKLGAMGAELAQLRGADARADVRDAAFKANPFNQLSNAVGTAAHHAGQAMNHFRPMPLPRPIFTGLNIAAAGAAAGAAGLAAGAAFAGATAGAAGLAISSAANFAQANLAASWSSSGSFSSSYSATSSWSGSSSSTVNLGSSSFSSSLSASANVSSFLLGGSVAFRAF